MNPWDGPIAAGVELAERGYLPDFVVRAAVRRLCQARLNKPLNGQADSFVASLYEGPISLDSDAANAQHYELPPEFFQLVLGPCRKYSCCLWSENSFTLSQAEHAALVDTAEHAELEDGQLVLELGCGWGALSLWLAEQYPSSRIVAVSNSNSQRTTIEAIARERDLNNLVVVTSDMNDFSPRSAELDVQSFDRIVSVEMFEHMRNYERLLNRIASWLRPDGKLLLHIFCHRELVYPFDTDGVANWMGRHFFTGGMMPSANLLHRFNRDLEVIRQWQWNGQHYARTALAWLNNLDQNHERILAIMRQAYGRENGARWVQRWRMFFIAVAELFAFRDGLEWFVGHYLMEQTATRKHSVAVLR